MFTMYAVWYDGFSFQRIILRLMYSFVLAMLLIISIWVTPACAQQQDKATIVIESVSNSTATRGKNLEVTYYQDEQCGRRGKSDKVFKQNYVKDLHTFNRLEVETDVRFIFQVSYLEKRRSETRACAAISSVELKPNRSYKAVFQVVDDVVGCNIRVFDVTDIIQNPVMLAAADQADASSQLQFLQVPVIDVEPESSCFKVDKIGYKSGTPVYSYKDRLG